MDIMDIMDNEIEKYVCINARKVARRCSLMDFDDAKQEMWAEVVFLRSKFSSKKRNEFIPLLRKHLANRAIDIMRKTNTRENTKAEYVHAIAVDRPNKQNSHDLLVLDIIRSIRDKTTKPKADKTIKILKQYVNPDAELISQIRETKDKRRFYAELQAREVAMYLGFTEMSVSRSRHIIFDAAQEILDD